MKTFDLTGTARADFGKKAAKSIRAEKKIPCVLYGGENNVNFVVETSDLRKLIYTPEVYLVNLTIDGKTVKAIVKEMQFHPLTEDVLHMDFLEVLENKPVAVEIPVQLTGLAEGVKAGGKLSLEMRKLRVKGMYNEIPERIVIDVTNVALGKKIQVADVAVDNLQILNAKNAVVAQVKLTRAARGAQAAAQQQ